MIRAAKRYSALYLYFAAIIGGLGWMVYFIFASVTAPPQPSRIEQVELRLNALTNDEAYNPTLDITKK